MQVLIEEFLNYLKVQKNYSINTITNYQRDLLLFNEYLEKESLSFKDLEYQDIRLFYNYMDFHFFFIYQCFRAICVLTLSLYI